MKMITNNNRNKLGAYLAVTAGAGCAGSLANGATVFINSDTGFAALDAQLGFSVLSTTAGPGDLSLLISVPLYPELRFGVFAGTNTPITGGYGYLPRLVTAAAAINSPSTNGTNLFYNIRDRATGGGGVFGTDNFVSLDVDGDGVFESVGQFDLDGVGGGRLIAFATNGGVLDIDLVVDEGLSLIDGVTHIQEASAVPEPSGLVLLGLGAAGLVARRQRKAA